MARIIRGREEHDGESDAMEGRAMTTEWEAIRGRRTWSGSGSGSGSESESGEWGAQCHLSSEIRIEDYLKIKQAIGFLSSSSGSWGHGWTLNSKLSQKQVFVFVFVPCPHSLLAITNSSVWTEPNRETAAYWLKSLNGSVWFKFKFKMMACSSLPAPLILKGSDLFLDGLLRLT